MSNYREDSKANWTSSQWTEHINAGSLQRIADAAEKMTASYDATRIDRDWWKARYETARHEADQAARSNRALRGVITKLKRQR